MPILIKQPKIIRAAGDIPKVIQEFVGRVNSETNKVSIARMQSPAGWSEPGQTPEFDEYTVVLKGTLTVKTRHEIVTVDEGQAIIVNKGEWVQYSTPVACDYIAVCMPAFSADTVHRD